MYKFTFAPGDAVKYSYAFPPPLAPLKGQITAEFIQHQPDGQGLILVGGFNSKQQVEVPLGDLSSQVYLDDPDFERNLYAAANKIGYKQIDLDEMLYDEQLNKFYTISEFEEQWEDYNTDEQPQYLYRTTSRSLAITSGEDLVENLIDSCRFEFPEDGWQSTDFTGVAELAAAVAKFNAANTSKIIYHRDHKRIVLLDRDYI
jgi:hypothetical protein